MSFTRTLPNGFVINMLTSSSNFHCHRNFHCEKIKNTLLYDVGYCFTFADDLVRLLTWKINFEFQKTWFECFNSNWNSNLKQSMTRIFRFSNLVSWDMNVISAILRKGENGSFSLFSKNRKISKWHFQEVSNNESWNTGLSRVESESVAETLKAVKPGI